MALPPIVPAILIGGAGTRLWPLSRGNKPKQFLRLFGDRSLFQETVLRFDGSDFTPPILMTNGDVLDHAVRQLDELERVAARIVVEPSMRGTAAALAALALSSAETDPRCLLLAAPADHVIARPVPFLEAVRHAAPLAASGSIVTFGSRPTAPETGFGYIRGGAPLSVAGHVRGYAISAGGFLEKPSREKAQSFVDQGYFWNAGIFLFSASTMISELERHAPKTLAAARNAVDRARRVRSHRGAEILSLDRPAFDAAPSDLSIDNAVMELTDRAAVVPCNEIGWSDVGSLSALWDIGDKDAARNVASGQAQFHQSSGSFIHSRAGRKVFAAHLSDVMIVDTEDCVVVLPREKAQDVRAIVKALRDDKDPLVDYTREASSAGASVRALGELKGPASVRIDVSPNTTLRLHTVAAAWENWVLVSGAAEATAGGATHDLQPGRGCDLRRGDTVRIAAGPIGASFIVLFADAEDVDLKALVGIEPLPALQESGNETASPALTAS